MALLSAPMASTNTRIAIRSLRNKSRPLPHGHRRRGLHHQSRKVPPFAFAFDAKPIPGAREALEYLQRNQVPFILLTNGGGKLEATRVADISKALSLRLDIGNFIQSHTPFADLVHGDAQQEALRDKCILVLGGNGDQTRRVAESYGFRNVLCPADLYHADPTLWPFASNFGAYYAEHARPLPRPIYPGPAVTNRPLDQFLQIEAMFVYSDPCDWGLSTALITDLLLSHRGYLGTRSGLNGRSDLAHHGYQQDGQPALWFSNPDLWWAGANPLPLLGQGAFHASLRGVWQAITEGQAPLAAHICGKPHPPTYAYAERRLLHERARVFGGSSGSNSALEPLERVYMIGDNPASDIAGANGFKSPIGSRWQSVLVRSGVYSGGTPAHPPTAIVADVWEAVRWALAQEGWGQVAGEAPQESIGGQA